MPSTSLGPDGLAALHPALSCPSHWASSLWSQNFADNFIWQKQHLKPAPTVNCLIVIPTQERTLPSSHPSPGCWLSGWHPQCTSTGGTQRCVESLLSMGRFRSREMHRARQWLMKLLVYSVGPQTPVRLFPSYVIFSNFFIPLFSWLFLPLLFLTSLWFHLY